MQIAASEFQNIFMRILLTIIALMAVVCCKNKPGGTGYHMPAAVMKQVLLDVNMAEAYSTVVKDSVHKPGTKNFDSLAVYYNAIFNHYKITPEQFKESLDWYKANPDKLDTMYTGMLVKVTKWQNSKPPEPPKPLPIPIKVPPHPTPNPSR